MTRVGICNLSNADSRSLPIWGPCLTFTSLAEIPSSADYRLSSEGNAENPKKFRKQEQKNGLRPSDPQDWRNVYGRLRVLASSRVTSSPNSG